MKINLPNKISLLRVLLRLCFILSIRKYKIWYLFVNGCIHNSCMH